MHCLESLAAGDTSPDIKDNVRQGGSHRHFYQATVGNLAGESEYRSTFAFFSPYAGKPISTLSDNDGDCCQGFYVVDVTGLSVKA